MLKSRRCIAQAKRKYHILIQTARCQECSAMYVWLVYFDLVIGTSQINTREHLGLRQFIQQIRDSR